MAQAKVEGRARRDLVLLFVLAAVLGTTLHFRAFLDPDRFHDNWRQVPHWTVPSSQHFQPGDLLIRYARFNTSPLANLLYPTLARTGVDILWGKINAVLFFVLTALLLYWTGGAMRDRKAGWAAALVFLFFPCQMKMFVGGFMSGLALPMLCLTLLLITTERWWWAIPLLAFQALTYPMTALHSGLLLAFDALWSDRHRILSGRVWKTRFLPLLLAAVASLALLGGKYSSDRHDFGRLATRSQIDHRLEFTHAGRSTLIPVPPIRRQLRRYWWNPFHVGLLLVAFLLLGKGVLRLPRGLWALLFSSLLMYWLADVFMMYFYFPNRYLRAGLPLFAALATGSWLSQMAAREWHPPRRSWAVLALALLLGLGFYQFGSKLVPGRLPTHRYARHGLYDFLRALPGRPLLAAHPYLASELPLLTGKSLLVTSEFSHPWWDRYWKIMVRRTHDFFRAYYTADPARLLAISDRYRIDYWVVANHHFSRPYLRAARYYFRPFNRWIRTHVRPSDQSLLYRVPEQYRLYEDDRYFVVSTAALKEWLGARGAEDVP